MTTNLKLSGIFVLIGCIFFINHADLHAQEGYSSASFSRTKQRSEINIFPLPNEIIIEEFVNYHRHDLPTPIGQESVAMNIRWGNNQVNSLSDEAILQIGLTTKQITDFSKMRPLNISLVIDKSGSMNGDKLNKTKEALQEFVKRLRGVDIISIIAFDNNADVVLSAQNANQQSKLKTAINSIETEGGTDLHSGIIAGYNEVLENYNTDRTNRIIVLTDAMTNDGIVDPEKIISNSKFYSKNNLIDFAFIGVGLDFNEDLARQLSSNSKNSIHFINDPEDIKKVFIDEVESLLSPIARDIKLEIEYDNTLEFKQMYGYEPKINNTKITLDLNNINSGLTQVILLKYNIVSKLNAKKAPVKVTLSYYDIQSNRKVKKDVTTILTIHENADKETAMLEDKSVKKNYIIAYMAQNLKDVATLYHNKKKQKATDLLIQTIKTVKSDKVQCKDADIVRVLKILENYNKELIANMYDKSNKF